jgi:hypothetical protein
MAFLPWEKLPDWISGPLLILCGAYLLVGEWPWSSWSHLQGVMFVIIGIWMFIHGIRKLVSEINDEPNPYPGTTRAYARDMTPDFSKYSASELRQILTKLDKERFPERAKEINDRLAAMSSRDRET